jgi:hypothetical protein
MDRDGRLWLLERVQRGALACSGGVKRLVVEGLGHPTTAG